MAAAQKVAGSALQAYNSSARLAPSLDERQSRGPGDSVNVTVFRPEDKASVVQAVRRLEALLGGGGPIPAGSCGCSSPALLEELSQLPDVVYMEPATTYSR